MFGQISQWNKVFHEGVEKMNWEPQEVYMRHVLWKWGNFSHVY